MSYSKPQNNLFGALRKYLSRQDENFATEALAYVIRRLLKCAAETYCPLMKLLIGAKECDNREWDKCRIVTQKTFAQGKPDISVTIPGDLTAIVEVKVGSGLGGTQLAKYREYLDNSKARRKHLTLLSRDPVPREKAPDADSLVRWYELAECCEDIRSRASADPVIEFVLEEFLEFLRERRMTMDPIRESLEEGVSSLASLMWMLQEEIAALPDPNCKPAYWTEGSSGLYFGPSNQEYWCGLFHTRARVLTFQAYRIAEGDAAHLLKLGWQWKPEGTDQQDVYFFELDLGKENFFDADPPVQRRRISEFVNGRISEVKGR